MTSTTDYLLEWVQILLNILGKICIIDSLAYYYILESSWWKMREYISISLLRMQNSEISLYVATFSFGNWHNRRDLPVRAINGPRRGGLGWPPPWKQESWACQRTSTSSLSARKVSTLVIYVLWITSLWIELCELMALCRRGKLAHRDMRSKVASNEFFWFCISPAPFSRARERGAQGLFGSYLLSRFSFLSITLTLHLSPWGLYLSG